ncbi:hypothetical protein [Sphingopyxis sp. KK2]|uniref:hypothetical protein n=1 Tax=Sphingopyxis sp. KK2 TaxID=1855727 RepID=UPI00118192A0|nr:hypothetical protein [Sphingopyxis sp. KK2]
MTRMIFAAAGGFALLAGVQAAAFEPLPDGTTTEERANTARLNAEQRARGEAEKAAYEQQLATIAQQEANSQAEFAEETAAYEAEKARVAAMSAEERIKWEADVAACKAGDLTRCAAPAVPPKP